MPDPAAVLDPAVLEPPALVELPELPQAARPAIIAAMFIIAILALTAEGLIGLLESRLLSWRPPSQTEVGTA